MNNKISKLAASTVKLAQNFEENFLILGCNLRELRAASKSEFYETIQIAGISYRKACFLIAIDQKFSANGNEKQRLTKIGWTKLSTIEPHITKDNYDNLLAIAEISTVIDLKIYLKDGHPSAPKRSVAFILDATQYSILEKALLLFGGILTPRGVANREHALVEMSKSALVALETL
jgi:hypothetical protein